VEKVILSAGPVSGPPAECPECRTPTIRDGEYIVCPNVEGCPAQTEGRIRQFIRELGIMEWGPKLVEGVVSKGLVKTVPDLFRLTVEQLMTLDRMGEASASKAIEELRKPFPVSLATLLGSLSIPLCGSSTMQLVVDAGFNSVEKLVGATMATLGGIPGLGPRRIEAISHWIAQNYALLEELLSCSGVSLKAKVVGSLSGTSVCFTGKSNLKRTELEKIAQDAGATVKNSVGKGLTYLVLADPSSSSSKAQAARKNGTTCISEEAFLEKAGVSK
jgi:DNA ligase (NAD+)